MQTEVFGVFGGLSSFRHIRSLDQFDRIATGERLTVGIRDPRLDTPGRTTTYQAGSSDDCCVIWGEANHGTGSDNTAKRLYHRYRKKGMTALDSVWLNGSYVAVLDADDASFVATDPIRSRDCFYADTEFGRVFGSDATEVARALANPTLDGHALAEFIHCGLVVSDCTPIAEVSRIPFDGYLTATETDRFARFVYQPRETGHSGLQTASADIVKNRLRPSRLEMDSSTATNRYATALAHRFQRAVTRRTEMNKQGTHGLLMGAGYNSRAILAAADGAIDVGYTLGAASASEVCMAAAIADQYGINHHRLSVTDEYLTDWPSVTQYTNGLRESIHIHHRGQNEALSAETIHHGLLLDTLLRGGYLPSQTVSLPSNREFPLPTLDTNPDITAQFVEKLGAFLDTDQLLIPDVIQTESKLEMEMGIDTEHMTPQHFARSVFVGEYLAGFQTGRVSTPHNAIDLLAMKCKSSLPFATQLADKYGAPLVAADSELLDWHLTTPPQYRNDRTYQRALKRIDPTIFRHRPPDRPHRSYQLNQIEKFLRKQVPGVRSFGTPWPDRERIYDRTNRDEQWFAREPAVQALPVRMKLRINDARTWIEEAINGH